MRYLLETVCKHRDGNGDGEKEGGGGRVGLI